MGNICKGAIRKNCYTINFQYVLHRAGCILLEAQRHTDAMYCFLYTLVKDEVSIITESEKNLSGIYDCLVNLNRINSFGKKWCLFMCMTE
jgi:hypothetical protein